MGGGLNQYERATDTFRHYRYDPDDATSLSSDSVSVLLQDRRGTLSVGARLRRFTILLCQILSIGPTVAQR